MAASKLFLGHHRLHHGPAAEASREGGADAGAGGFRFGFRNVLFSTGFLMPSRRDAAPPEVAGAEVKQTGPHAGGDRAEKAAALGSKFEEAVELSCWST